MSLFFLRIPLILHPWKMGTITWSYITNRKPTYRYQPHNPGIHRPRSIDGARKQCAVCCICCCLSPPATDRHCSTGGSNESKYQYSGPICDPNIFRTLIQSLLCMAKCRGIYPPQNLADSITLRKLQFWDDLSVLKSGFGLVDCKITVALPGLCELPTTCLCS